MDDITNAFFNLSFYDSLPLILKNILVTSCVIFIIQILKLVEMFKVKTSFPCFVVLRYE